MDDLRCARSGTTSIGCSSLRDPGNVGQTLELQHLKKIMVGYKAVPRPSCQCSLKVLKNCNAKLSRQSQGAGGPSKLRSPHRQDTLFRHARPSTCRQRVQRAVGSMIARFLQVFDFRQTSRTVRQVVKPAANHGLQRDESWHRHRQENISARASRKTQRLHCENTCIIQGI